MVPMAAVFKTGAVVRRRRGRSDSTMNGKENDLTVPANRSSVVSIVVNLMRCRDISLVAVPNARHYLGCPDNLL